MTRTSTRFYLSTWVTCAQVTTGKHWVIWSVLYLLHWCHFNDFQKVELGCRVLFTLNNQHVFETLMIVGAIQCFTIAQTVELKAFQGFTDTTWIECASAVTCICIEQSLTIYGVCRLLRREAVFGAKGLNKGFGAFVL